MKTAKTSPEKGLVLGYCRVSDEKQVEFGHSLEAQRAKIEAQAVVEGVSVSEIITDEGGSGKNLERPGIQRIIREVCAGHVQTVIIAKLDRLTRSVRDLNILIELLEHHGASLISVADHLDTHSAAGRLVLNIMASVSQWEREAIGERTREVLQHMKAQGKRVGNIPYGWRLAEDGVQLEKDPYEQKVIDSAIHYQQYETFSPTHIAKLLNARGLHNRNGRGFTKQAIHKLLS